jgi:DNA/RNA-binding domain of Phe-tRNA-synthetase-like protein
MFITVEQPFWQLFPQARIGLVIASNINNAGTDPAPAELLASEIAATSAAFANVDMATHPVVAPWRNAYRAFGAKPAQFRSSIESLVRSAVNERLRSINPLVDLYNVVSLRHRLPCGGEDLAAIVGNIQLTRAQGGEPFRTIGATEDDPPPAGEVIYRDDAGVICRCFNWREADRTQLRPGTTHAMLVIEALAEHPDSQLAAALSDLATLITTYLGATTRQVVLRQGQASVVLE